VCRERGTRVRQLDAGIRYEHTPGQVTADSVRWPRVRVTTERRAWPAMEVELLGEHQAANAALAVAAVEELQGAGLHIGDLAVAEGLAKVRWPARLEVVGSRPLVVLDCAHNLASAQALVDTLEASFPAAADSGGNGHRHGGRRLVVFAGSNDKDLAG